MLQNDEINCTRHHYDEQGPPTKVFPVDAADCFPETDPTLGYDPENPYAPPWVPNSIAAEIQRLSDLEPLPIPSEDIKALALRAVNEPSVIDDAKKAFAADARRDRRLALFNGLLAALEKLISHRPEHGDRVAAAHHDTELYQFVHSTDDSYPLFHLRSVPFLLGSILLICIVLASCNNGLYFLRSVEFTTSVWDAFCISAIFTFAPMILSHFVLNGLALEARRRAERILKIVSIPSCCAAVLIFAYSFGRAQELTGLFEQTSGFHIPVWVVVFFSMELESLASIAMFSSLAQQYRALFPKRTIESQASVETRIQLGRSDHFSAVCIALRVRLEARVAHHEAEARDYVRRYLAAYQLARLQMASETEAHAAQAKLESMQMRLKIAS